MPDDSRRVFREVKDVTLTPHGGKPVQLQGVKAVEVYDAPIKSVEPCAKDLMAPTVVHIACVKFEGPLIEALKRMALKAAMAFPRYTWARKSLSRLKPLARWTGIDEPGEN